MIREAIWFLAMTVAFVTFIVGLVQSNWAVVIFSVLAVWWLVRRA